MTSKTLALCGAAFALFAHVGPALADEACLTAFRQSVQPLLNTNCVGCHQDAAPGAGLSLQRSSAPASLLDIPSTQAPLPLIAPGDPEQSYLFHKIAGTHGEAGGLGERMPLGGPLSDADIAVIEDWILGCAAP